MKNLMLLSILFLLGITTITTTQAQTRQADSLALVIFHNSCCGIVCTLNWDFNQSMDNWTGVTLTNGRVTRLSATHKNLTGSLADWNLSALNSLRLNNNQLTGSIPDFSNLPNLEFLSLHVNQLTGNIPNFSNLSNLEFLDLSSNQLSGNIPNFSNLPALNNLSLGYNQLSGNIPDFSNLPALQTLFLPSNQLSGNIPDFSNLPALQTLFLPSNQLSSNIPNFSNLSNLGELTLSYNQLSGNIPNFSNLPNLSWLNLSQNQLTFENIIPNYSHLNNQLSSYLYTPQDSIGTATIATPTVGSSYTIDLVIDDMVSTNVYYWYKDGALIDTTFGINEYTISNFQMADAGTYTAQIKNTIVTNPSTNNSWQTLILHSRPVTLQIGTSTTPIKAQPLQVSPNPVQDMLYIQTQPVTADYTLQVINLQGQILENLTGNGNRLFMLPMAKYPAGMYIVRLQQGDEIWQQKVVKQ